MRYSEKLHSLIPGGSHTYSKGDDQFPDNAPEILTRGKGSTVWGANDDSYLDYGMGLRSVSIGYADETINAKVIESINLGNNLSRPSHLELQAAEKFVELIPSAEMVKFAKNGSNVTTAAIKLSRGYTGKSKILRCRQHPFFSFDNWFIGSTEMNKGVPSKYRSDTLLFDFNNATQVERIIEESGFDVACIILEPAADTCPSFGNKTETCCGLRQCNRAYSSKAKQSFLTKLRGICDKYGIVLIFDEMITGFRWDIGGAQTFYGVNPDLSTFGKAMANGFSVAALCGKKALMSLGSTDVSGRERLFLLSSTHGAEMTGLAAFLATVSAIEQRNVIEHLWNYGSKFVEMFNQISIGEKMDKYIFLKGPVVNPVYFCLDFNGNSCFALRTLFNKELIKAGVLMPWISFSLSHGPKELYQTGEALQKAMRACRTALNNDSVNDSLRTIQRPVFRKYN